MLSFLFMMATVALIAVGPLMFSARYFGAAKSSFTACLVGVIAVAIVLRGLEELIPSFWVSLLLGILISGAILAEILGANYKTGLKISVLMNIISVLVSSLFLALYT